MWNARGHHRARADAPGWAKHLAGVDPKSVTSRAALARLPVLRKSDLVGLQKDTPPFGGYNVTAPGKAKRILMSPGPIFEIEGHGKDFAGVARALFAAGFRTGDVVHNCFSYHLTPGAWMFDSGAEALGCPIIPGGVGNTEQQVEAISALKPRVTSARPISSKSSSIARKNPARTSPRSSAGLSRAPPCRRRCGRNCPAAASKCCNATPSPRPA
jgi:phenylacetate-coenzyme A ligase PaaK-like adenylate-forming protein